MKFQSTDESWIFFLSIGAMFPMSPMYQIFFLARLDRLDVAERCAVAHAEDHVGTRGDHARRDALAAGGVVVGGRADRREDDLDVFETLRTPAAKPPDISYQFVSEAEMTMPTVPVFVVLAARMPAR